MQLSDLEIEFIIKKIESAYQTNNMPKYKKKNFLLNVENLLKKTFNYDVCHLCLGTGKK